MGFQSMGQSIMLQYCTNRGGGWEQRSGVTGSVLLPPRATSWMHWTSRDWMPPPHVFEHGEKSEMFQRGGHGMSLHVRVIESGRVSMRHRAGFTCSSSEIRTHSVIDSCTPFFCFLFWGVSNMNMSIIQLPNIIHCYKQVEDQSIWSIKAKSVDWFRTVILPTSLAQDLVELTWINHNHGTVSFKGWMWIIWTWWCNDNWQY